MVLKEKMASVLELIRKSDLESAKKQLEFLAQSAKSDRERGSIAALSGIVASISRGKEGTMQTWEPEKMSRAAATIKRKWLGP